MEEKIEKIEERISKFLLKFPRIARLLHYDLDGTKETNRSKKEKVNLEGMSELSKTIFNGYQKRRTNAQKERFIELLKSYGFRPDESRDPPEQNDSIKSCNLVFGDVSKAKIIISAHYDTPLNQSYKILPTIKRIRKIKKATHSRMRKMICILLSIIAVFIVICAFANLSPFAQSLVVALLFLLLLCLVVMSLPFPNPYNYNDNTSGVITLCELFHETTEEEKEIIAFVLYDNEEKKYIGSQWFKVHHNSDNLNNKVILNFDCVADGSHICISFMDDKSTYKKTFENVFINDDCKLWAKYGLSIFTVDCEQFATNSDHKSFENGIGIGAFHKNKLGFYYLSRFHTKRDTHFDMDNIHYLVEGIKRLLKELP